MSEITEEKNYDLDLITILSRVLSVWHLKPKGKKLNQLKTGVYFQLLSLHSLCLLSLLDCLLGTWLLNLINVLLLFPLSDTEKLELIEYWLTELVTARHCYQPPVCSLVCARAEDELGAPRLLLAVCNPAIPGGTATSSSKHETWQQAWLFCSCCRGKLPRLCHLCLQRSLCTTCMFCVYIYMCIYLRIVCIYRCIYISLYRVWLGWS